MIEFLYMFEFFQFLINSYLISHILSLSYEYPIGNLTSTVNGAIFS